MCSAKPQLQTPTDTDEAYERKSCGDGDRCSRHRQYRVQMQMERCCGNMRNGIGNGTLNLNASKDFVVILAMHK